MLALISRLSEIKKEYDKIEQALKAAREEGYGFVSPTLDEFELAEPEIYRQGTKFGVKLKATAPSLHIMKANIHTEVSPLIGQRSSLRSYSSTSCLNLKVTLPRFGVQTFW